MNSQQTSGDGSGNHPSIKHDDALLRATIDTSLDAIVSMDAAGRVTEWNRAAERMFSYSRDEAMGCEMAELIIPPSLREAHRAGLARYLATGEERVLGRRLEITAVRADGSEFPVELAIARMPSDGPPIFTGYVRDITERVGIERAAREQALIAALQSDIGIALIQHDTLPGLLHRCVEAFVQRLDAAFARIWTLNEADNVLELQASAGLYTHLNGPHGRVPVGQFKIGLIAKERTPHFTNAVLDDPRVGDKEWARREGMVAFAGYPLIVEDRLVGVLAMFSRQPLTSLVLDAMEAVANGIAGGIERKRAEHALRTSETLLSITLKSIGDAVITTDAAGRVTFLNAVAEELTGWTDDEASGLDVRTVFRIVNETTRLEVESPVAKCLRDGVIAGLANHTILLAKDGREIPIDDSGAPIRGADGAVVGVVLVFRDISERKVSENEQHQFIAALEKERSRLADLLQQAPAFVAILRGAGHVFEIVNPLYLKLVGHRDILGKPVSLALPEVAAQGFISILDHVYQTGETFVGTEIPLKLQRLPTGPMEERVLNFVYQALREPDGSISGIFVHGVDVTDQIEARKELEARAEKLLAADKAKDEFLAMLGHELRNPLSGMSNALYLVKTFGRDIPKMEKPLETLSRQTEHLSRLMNDLLDVARITQGKIALKRKPLSLNEAVTAAVQSLAPQVDAKGLELRMELEGRPIVSADPLRLEQVLSNLLTNAIKYTERGTIAVSVKAEDRDAVITVTDTGVGIDPDVLPDIFDLFRQVDATLDRSRGGLGIGLTLVKRLVEMHGGSVAAASEGRGYGCTFTVTLPQADAVAPGTDEAGAAVERPSTGMRILVVDDNVDAAETLGEILDVWGHSVTVVHNGEAALNAVKTDGPALVLLDIGLPDIDGYEVARRIRADAETGRAIKLVALTGYGQEEDQRRAREAGFDHHLTKPVDLAAMQALLTHVDEL